MAYPYTPAFVAFCGGAPSEEIARSSSVTCSLSSHYIALEAIKRLGGAPPSSKVLDVLEDVW